MFVQRLRCGLLAILMLIGVPAFGGINRWTNHGPRGAMINRVLDPGGSSVLYAGSYGGGVFRSDDDGNQWIPMNDGLTDPMITQLTKSRDYPYSLYAGTSRGEVFENTYGKWFEIGKFDSAISSLDFDGGSDVLFATAGGSVYRLLDGATAWEHLDGGPNVYRLAVLRGKVYVFSDQSLRVSSDGGSHWQDITSLRAGTRPGLQLSSLSADEDRSTLYVGASKTVFTSADEGRTFTEFRVSDGSTPCNCHVTDVQGSAEGFVVATTSGVFTYEILGGSWHRVGGFAASATYVTNTAGRIFASGSQGLFVHQRNAADWTPLNDRFENQYSTDVAIDGEVAYVATPLGLFRSDDNGQSFHAITTNYALAVAVAADPLHTLFVGGVDGVQKSTDRGRSWKFVAPRGFVRTLGVAPSNPNILYASTSSGAFRSNDLGETWASVAKDLLADPYGDFDASAMAIDPTNANVVYLASYTEVLKTTDGGNKWVSVRSGPSFTALTVDRSGIVYAATGDGGVVKSSDGGQTWTEAGLGIEGHVSSLAADPTHPSVLYAATSEGHVYQTASAGAKWLSIDQGLSGAAIFRLAVSVSGDHLYAATAGGVFEYQQDTSTLAPGIRYQVSFQTYYSNFVSVFAGDDGVNANGPSAGDSERFTLYDVNGGELFDGDTVYLQASNGSFLAAENGGSKACGGCESPVNANRLVAGAWESFVIHRMSGSGVIATGDAISLQARAGDYVAAENGGMNGCGCDSRLNANRPSAHEWETFRLTIH